MNGAGIEVSARWTLGSARFVLADSLPLRDEQPRRSRVGREQLST